jgi:hypothetical protein
VVSELNVSPAAAAVNGGILEARFGLIDPKQHRISLLRFRWTDAHNAAPPVSQG